MKIENNNLIGTNSYLGFGAKNKYDPKEAAVAKKLGMSVKEFSALPEEEKMQKVQTFNQSHPNDKIADKGAQPQEPQGTQMAQFHNDVNWANVKLE